MKGFDSALNNLTSTTRPQLDRLDRRDGSYYDLLDIDKLHRRYAVKVFVKSFCSQLH